MNNKIHNLTGSGATIISKRNSHILGLALKCRLITVEQEKKILSQLIEKQQNTPDYSIVKLFREEDYLSEANIDFLFAVKQHLKLKMLDKRFGELGVANKLIRPENVKKALDLQSEIFKKTNESRLIGDILLEQEEITKATKASILLSQDRVKDELLAEAINDIASTKMEKISVNMRFGAIAVKKGFITITQLNQALQVQKDEGISKNNQRYLGEILKELFGLSDKDLTYILKIQKELEKQRLSLEKALSQYNLEENINKRLGKIFEYRFSRNKLEAYIRIAENLLEEILVSDILNWLKSIGIRFGICDEQSIKDFITKGVKGSEIKIAKGYLPTDPVNESMEFLFDTKINNDPANQNSPRLSFVKKGDVLARITPHQEGNPGKDVCGFTIPPQKYEIIPLGSGKGVVKKGLIFFADTDGNPVLFKNRTLFVTHRDQEHPVEHFSGHVRTDLGKKYQSANLTVDGNIEKDGRVTCHKLIVKGDVRGQIHATGNVQIKGDVGENTGMKIPNPVISSHGDIIVNKTIANSVIITSKMLKAPNSDLISSQVFAFQDIILKNIYSKKSSPTILQIGKKPDLEGDAINQSIDEQKKVLNKLLHEDDLVKINHWFDDKIKVQNDFLEQQNILKQILELLEDKTLEKFKTLELKIRAFTLKPGDQENNNNQNILKTTDLKPFIAELIKDTRKLSLKDLKIHVEETLDIKFGMYRAAVNATQRHKNEYNAQKDFILKKVEKLRPEITKQEQKIDDLYKKKDFLKLSESNLSLPVSPAIRVKNQIEKTTVIKGKKSAMALKETIYGIKLFEQQKSAAEKPQIVIEGFYD